MHFLDFSENAQKSQANDATPTTHGRRRYRFHGTGSGATVLFLRRELAAVSANAPFVAVGGARGWRERAGIADLAMHDQRSEGALRKAEDKGLNILELAAQGGWHDLRVLRKYFQPDAARIAAKSSSMGA